MIHRIKSTSRAILLTNSLGLHLCVMLCILAFPINSKATETKEIYHAAKESLENGDCENAKKLFNEYISLEEEYLKKHPSFYKQIQHEIDVCKEVSLSKRNNAFSVTIHSRAKKAKKSIY